MARTQITPQQIPTTGRDPVFEPANVDGNSFKLAPGRFLHVKNGSAGAVTVTVPTPGTVDGLAIADLAVSVPAAGERLIALGAGSTFRQSGGSAYVDYSAVASVTVGVFTATV